MLECRLASRLGLGAREARRLPLALALLRLNYLAQAEGCETWWRAARERRRGRAEMAEEMAALFSAE